MHDLATDVLELFEEASHFGRPYRSIRYRFGEGYGAVSASGLRTKDDGDPEVFVAELMETQRLARAFRQEEIARAHVVDELESVRPLVDWIAMKHGLPAEEMLGRSRAPHVVEARLNLFVCLRGKGWSLPRIGRLVGRDHTTILHALQRGPDLRRTRNEPLLTSARVFESVAAKHGLTAEDILGRSRKLLVVEARRDVCLRLREQGWSYPAIGRAVNRDHATIMSLLARPARDLASAAEVVSSITRTVCDRHGVLPEQLFAHDRRAALMRAREDLCVELRKKGCSVSAIARAVRRDRTCVILALRKNAA